uniref:Uncharacterized protein n=1 Tax=Otus sunia TaxID=257818 RepID=A0A8C8EFB4_9STRI
MSLSGEWLPRVSQPPGQSLGTATGGGENQVLPPKRRKSNISELPTASRGGQGISQFKFLKKGGKSKCQTMTWDGSHGQMSCSDGALLWDTSTQVFACKLGMTSEHSLHLQMPLQVVLRGC